MNTEDPQPQTGGPGHGYGWRKLLFTLGVLTIAWVIFAQVAPRITLNEGPHSGTASKEDVKALLARVDALEKEVNFLKENSGGQNNEVLAGLQKKLRVLQLKSRRPVKDERVDELQQQVASQQETLNKLQSETATQLAGVTAFNQLRETVLRGEPYSYELKQFKALMQDRQDVKKPLEALAVSAGSGMPTLETLQLGFERAVPRALEPDVKPDSLMGNLRSLISIRKIGNPEGNDVQAIIARAENALKEGRVKSSLQLINPLPAKSSAVFAEWKNDARRYVMNRDALDSLEVMFALKPKEADSKNPTIPPPEVPARITIEDSAAPGLKVLPQTDKTPNVIVNPPAHD